MPQKNKTRTLIINTIRVLFFKLGKFWANFDHRHLPAKIADFKRGIVFKIIVETEYMATLLQCIDGLIENISVTDRQEESIKTSISNLDGKLTEKDIILL